MRAVWLACGIALLIAAAAAAEEAEAPVYARSGVYAGITGSAIIENFENELPNGFDVDDSSGISGRLGYRIDRYFSIEAKFEWIDDFDIGGVADGDLDTVLGTLNAKAYLLPSRIQPFLLLGIGAVHFDLDTNVLSEDSTAFLFQGGGGIDFYLTEYIALGFEVTYAVTDDDDFDDFEWTTLGGGLQYRF